MTAPRATITDVRQVLVFSEDLVDISGQLQMAHDLVEEVCVAVVQSESRLKSIEVYLTAHFVSIFEVQVESESAGPVSAKYRGKIGLGLEATLHGQQSLLLDLSGGLVALHNTATGKDSAAPSGRTATITYLGLTQEPTCL